MFSARAFSTIMLTSLLMAGSLTPAWAANLNGMGGPTSRAGGVGLGAGHVAGKGKVVVKKVSSGQNLKGSRFAHGASRPTRAPVSRRPVAPPMPPQQLSDFLSSKTVAPGVIYRTYKGSQLINVIEVDLKRPELSVKPVMASNSFNRLEDVSAQASKVNAIAAVNANYFKHDGTPLGTLIVDGEWISGPIYNRVSMGLMADGNAVIDKLFLHGNLETSNPAVGSLWVNTINQPRRTGSHLCVYTRRWGNSVKLPYAGCLAAVDHRGVVIDKSRQIMDIPKDGYVLCDSRGSQLEKLSIGDVVNLDWLTKPERWQHVLQAVSGGPVLIRNGKLFVDLKGEHFRTTWTSNSIHARTALGITRDKRLLLVTVEGVHTLWDVAKLLQKLGAVDAMNLDGGGSTTMVVRGKVVTRNNDKFQRRVATSLAVLATANYIGNARPTAPSLASFSWSYDPVDLAVAPFDVTHEAESVRLADPYAASVDFPNLARPAAPVAVVALEPDSVLRAVESKTEKKQKRIKVKKEKSPAYKKYTRWFSEVIPGI